MPPYPHHHLHLSSFEMSCSFLNFSLISLPFRGECAELVGFTAWRILNAMVKRNSVGTNSVCVVIKKSCFFRLNLVQISSFCLKSFLQYSSLLKRILAGPKSRMEYVARGGRTMAHKRLTERKILELLGGLNVNLC